MTTTLTEPEIILRALLSGGPRCSREVLAEMAARGISAKQVRTARERQRIAMHRTGSGKEMRTTWALLPEGGIHAPLSERSSTRAPARLAPGMQPCGSWHRSQGGAQSEPLALGGQQTPTSAGMASLHPAKVEPQQTSATPLAVPAGNGWAAGTVSGAAELNIAEHRRRETRIRALRAQGLDASESQAVADALATADRQGVLALGSCAQCHWWGTDGCREVRPAVEVHVCWRRRAVIA